MKRSRVKHLGSLYDNNMEAFAMHKDIVVYTKVVWMIEYSSRMNDGSTHTQNIHLDTPWCSFAVRE